METPIPNPTSWFQGSGACSEEILGGRRSSKFSVTARLPVSLKVPSEEIGETTCGELKLVGSESSTGDTITGLLCTDERGSLLADLHFVVLGVLFGVALPRRVTVRSCVRADSSGLCRMLGVLSGDLFEGPVLAPGSWVCASSVWVTGVLGLLWRTVLRVDFVGGLGAPNFPSSIGEVVEGRCRDWHRAKDAFKLSCDVTALRRPRPGVVDVGLELIGSGIGDGEVDLERATDDLVGARRREMLDDGGTFSLFTRLLEDSRPTIGMRLCLLTLRSPSGVILKVNPVWCA